MKKDFKNKIRPVTILIVFMTFVATSIVVSGQDQHEQQYEPPYSYRDYDWNYCLNYPDMFSIPPGNVGIGTQTPTENSKSLVLYRPQISCMQIGF